MISSLATVNRWESQLAFKASRLQDKQAEIIVSYFDLIDSDYLFACWVIFGAFVVVCWLFFQN